MDDAQRLRNAGKLRRARQKLKLALREAAHFPEDDPRIATTLCKLIEVHVELNDALLSADEALALAQHSARVHKICFEKDGEKAAAGLISAGALLNNYGWFPDAEELLADAIKCVRSHRPRTPATYDLLFNALYNRILLVWSHPEFAVPHSEVLELIDEACSAAPYLERDVHSPLESMRDIYKRIRQSEANAADDAPPWTSSNQPVQSLVKLLAVSDELQDDVRAEILRKGKHVVPALIAIMEDDDLARDNAPGDGFVPSHAICLLAELNATEAIEPMLRVLSRCDFSDDRHGALLEALASFGEASLEPALTAYSAAKTDDARDGIAVALAEIGVKDDRVFSILIELLARNTGLGAGMLGAYGDEAALPYLSNELDATFIPGSPNFALPEKLELVSAIERLGGSLTQEQARQWESAQCNRPKSSISFDEALRRLLMG